MRSKKKILKKCRRSVKKMSTWILIFGILTNGFAFTDYCMAEQVLLIDLNV